MRRVEAYVERAPRPELAGIVRTVWIQRTGASGYAQRHLPTAGVEIHWPLGRRPTLLGPLTEPQLELVPAHTTIVGVRFRPGAAPLASIALDALVDQRGDLADLWGGDVDRLGETAAAGTELTATPALALLQARVLHEVRTSGTGDPLVHAAVEALMPWRPVDVRTVAAHLALSASQLRRRCLHTLGLGPKAVQRTLRFQGFLALAQAGETASGRRGADGMAGLAIDVGYADQAHLSRECMRLTGVTPTQLLGGDVDRCRCGHDHAASYRPFLASRRRVPRIA